MLIERRHVDGFMRNAVMRHAKRRAAGYVNMVIAPADESKEMLTRYV